MSAPPLYILDTNILLALVRGKELGQRINDAYALSSSPTRPIISIVTEAELRTLARVKGWGEQKMRVVGHLLENVTKVSVHVPEVMSSYVEVELASRAHPGGARNMGKNDVWIAATARATGAVLITTDADFDHLSPEVIRVIRISVAWRRPQARPRDLPCPTGIARPSDGTRDGARLMARRSSGNCWIASIVSGTPHSRDRSAVTMNHAVGAKCTIA